MPYELSFAKSFPVTNDSIYINECCWGGDVIRDLLLPRFANRVEHLQTAQEDWGWFIWFRRGSIRLGIDIYCDDRKSGAFRVWLSAARTRFMRRMVEVPAELDDLLHEVQPALMSWAGPLQVEHIE